MTNIQENLGLVIGSIIAALGFILGYVLQSGVLNTLVGVAIGAGITYYVQTKTQKNAWKREYSVKIAETIYGSLYSEVKEILFQLKNGEFMTIGFRNWRTFQNDHRHLMVTEEFRRQLDEFLRKVDEYDNLGIRLINEVFPSIVNEALEKIFGLLADRINIDVEFKTPTGFSKNTFDAVSCLIKRGHPRELVMQSCPRCEVVSVRVQFINIRQTFGSELKLETAEEDEFNKFWELCISKEKKNEIFRLAVQKQSELLEEATHILDELTKRIEEPWRI